MKKVLLVIGMVLIVLGAIGATYYVTMHSLEIRVTDDTAYVTAFGQTDEYDYLPDF